MQLLPSLEVLSFHFGETSIQDDEAIYAIKKAISLMKKLTSLTFNIYGKDVTISKEAAISLAATLLEHESLRELKRKLKSQSFPPEDISRAYHEID